MAYDISAVVASAIIAGLMIKYGIAGKGQTILVAICCLILGATSFVMGLLRSTVFSAGVNAYAVAALVLLVLFWIGPKGGKFTSYLVMACAVILGSSDVFTSWLPAVVNGWFAGLGAFFGSTIGQ